MEKALQTDTKRVKEGAGVLRAINNRFRLKIIKLLDEKKRMNDYAIYTKLKFEQSVVSQHVRILREARLVNTEREGREIYYTINYDRFEDIDRSVKAILK